MTEEGKRKELTPAQQKMCLEIVRYIVDTPSVNARLSNTVYDKAKQIARETDLGEGYGWRV